MNRLTPFSLALALAAPALAQSSISPFAKYSWSENCGWMNWRDAGSPESSQGVRVAATFLAGFVWCENIGWINLGDGTPADSSTYANANGTDFGINLAANGNLSGMAWGENVGWINFSGGNLAGGNATAAKLDRAMQRFRGYAWGENIGWINLNDATHFVGLGCPADLDDGSFTGTPDGGVTIDDLLYYLAIFEQGVLAADLDDGSSNGTPDGGVTIDDLLYFLVRFEAGC